MHTQTGGLVKSRDASRTPAGPRHVVPTDPASPARPALSDPSLQQACDAPCTSAAEIILVQEPDLSSTLESPSKPQEGVEAAPTADPANEHANTHPHSYRCAPQAVDKSSLACCQCGGPTVSQLVAEQRPTARVDPAVQAPPMPLRNPARQSMVSSLEKALADLERDVLARSAQPSESSVPSFAASLDSLAALESEIAAQQRRLANVGIVPRTGLDQLSRAPQLGNPPNGAATSHLQSRQEREMPGAVALVPCSSHPPAEAWTHAGACAKELAGDGAVQGAPCSGPQRPGMLQEPSFSHSVSSTPESRWISHAADDRTGSSSPDGNFSTVSIEDRLKRLGLSVRSAELQ